jgi:hypothetical protein
VTRLRTLIDGEADAAAQHLEKARPQVGNDPQSLLRLQQRWDQVRMRLDSGASLQRVIASADADTLTAIREWAPTWLAAQADSARPAGMEGLEFDDPDVAPIMRSLDERLAEVSGNGFSTVNQRAKEAAGDAAYAASVAPRLEGQLQGINVGSDGLTAAVEAHYAAANATAGLPPPDDDGGES